MREQWKSINVANHDMNAFIATPERAEPLPGVVIIQGQKGVDKFLQETTKRLAASGYICIAPTLYHRQNLNKEVTPVARRAMLLDSEIIEDVNATVDYLKKHRSVRNQAIGIMGFCMGGRVSYLMAAVNPSLKAAIAFYGGNTMESWGEGPTPFERLSNIACPVLGIFGEEDHNPSLEDMEKLDAELTRHGKQHEMHAFPNAGHAFMDFSAPRYSKDAAEGSWKLVTTFLDRYLVD